MRNYEIAFIAHPELDDEAFTALIEKIKGWITAAGGAVGDVDRWGRRRLAYPIRKQREGQYAFIPAQMPASFTGELERNLRFAEPVMRFLITTVEG
ncbi:MAG: 30S ribosomal protein S6 [Chloroflexi bacterium]|nr:30S ribosomal protein S6 [Chloroflexota bacterium]MBI3762518.1 30S ribosomal protein S6 [Chloroflexota bacterium]